MKPNCAPRIAAVVVSHDRPALLALAIAALRAQRRAPDRIFVVDNASAAPTAVLLAGLTAQCASLSVLRSEDNLGGAGGFALGLAHACAAGYDWVWLLDDDAIARPDALLELERAMPALAPDAGALCGAVVEFGALALMHRRSFARWSGRERPTAARRYGGPAARIDTASFVGFLVAATAVARVGLPEAGFFVAYDDTDYSLRLRRAGLGLWLVPASVIDHLRDPAARLRHSRFGPRHYFNIRNRMVVARRHAALPLLPTLAAGAVGVALWLVSDGWRQPGSLRILARALGDGYGERLGAYPAALAARPPAAPVRAGRVH